MTANQPQAVGAGRPIYLRLMRRKAHEVNLADEAQVLAEVLRAGPGVIRAQVGERHPKGGHRVTLELTWQALDAVIAYLESHGWMSVM